MKWPLNSSQQKRIAFNFLFDVKMLLVRLEIKNS